MQNLRILIIGYSTRYIVCAAKRAGYTVYSLDHFGDVDMLRCADGYARFDEMTSEEDLLDLLNRLNWDFDAIILGTGFECFDLKGYRVLNNRAGVVRSISNKKLFGGMMKSLGFQHPEIYDISDDFGYPVMIKPVYGSGGIENRLAHSREETRGCGTDMLIQEYLEGVPASVSVISTREDAVAIAVNEQLIGTPWLTRDRFAYCGNVTPFRSEYDSEMREIAVQLIQKLGLIGSNGVDFLITENGPVVIEVNARFQGTLDTVEYASGISVFDAHVRAFSGELVEVPSDATERRFAGRAVLFADTDVTIDEVISKKLEKERIMDIPQTGWRISAGDPVTTIFCEGKSREQVVQGLRAAAGRIRELMQPSVATRKTTHLQNL
ncbi:MAG TPA: ATP-grasp domain-containing protein [Methanosarcinales archaeon]|nr:ATP-grasp domain-containing protein [Methanosarcinales archaeon]